MLPKGGCLQHTELSTSSDSTLTTTRKNHKHKRRFSDAQIKSMQAVFETEPKLEPNSKIQLAKELDLQPQQVDTWFQNKRARLKSKKLERDFCLLKANYDALATKFESINKEKKMLLVQLQNIIDMGRNPDEESKTSPFSMDGNITDGDSDNGAYSWYGPQQKAGTSLEESDFRMPIYSEEAYLMGVMDPANSILAPTFDPSSSFDQSCSTSQLWKLWS